MGADLPVLVGAVSPGYRIVLRLRREQLLLILALEQSVTIRSQEADRNV